MKRNFLLIGILIWNINSIFAQICGTPHPVNQIIYPQEQNNTKAKESNLLKGSSSAICINVFFHIVRNTNGTNAFAMPNTNDITADLNEFFSPHNIIFNNLGSDFIDDTNYVDLTRNEADNLDDINNRSDAINYYIVDNLWDDVAGVVTNGLPNRNLFIEDDWVNNFVSPHEVGHCLNLYHTHKGSAYGDAGCPEAINGSNCTNCGDSVCDTPADSGIGTMNGFNPDMTNLMSYYHLSPWFNNLDHFTDGQGWRMRYAINFESVLQGIKSKSCTKISKITTICYPQTTTVTLSNLGNATTVWSSSSNVQIVTSNNSSATIRGSNANVSGDGWVMATLSNGITFQENFHVGRAEPNNIIFRNSVGGTYYWCSSHNNNEFEILPKTPNTSYEVRVRDFPNLNIVDGPYNFTGNIATLPNSYNYSPGWYIFEVRATNECGTTDWFGGEVEFVDCSIGGGGEFRVYPNPSSETLTVKKNSYHQAGSENLNSIIGSFELYDFSSNLIISGKLSNHLTIDVSKYKRGKYILKINSEGKIESHQIIIE